MAETCPNREKRQPDLWHVVGPPRLTAWEVKALMEKICRDLGALGRDSKLGAGLLNALAAIRAAQAARN